MSIFDSLLGSHTITIDNTHPSPTPLSTPKPTPMPTPASARPHVTPDAILHAIAINESGGLKNPYSFYQNSGNKMLGNALGKYQVTEGELKTYAKRYLGHAVDTKSFLSNPKAQDAYMLGKINSLLGQNLTPAQILEIHRGGLNVKFGTYPDYVKKGLSNL